MSTLILTPKGSSGEPGRFSRSFTVGRDETCALCLNSQHVSRFHASIAREGNGWWATDLGSTNGIILDGARVERGELTPGASLQFGRGGPAYDVSLGDESDMRADANAADLARTRPFKHEREGPSEPPQSGADPRVVSTPASAPEPSDVSRAVEKYFAEGDGGGGQQTRMIRLAYKEAKKRDQRPFWVSLGVLLLALASTGTWLLAQQSRLNDLEAQAGRLFHQLRETDLLLTNFRRTLEQTAGSPFEAQLAGLERQRTRQREEYEGYVEQLGFYRRLRSDEERAVYRMARIFGESEFSMQREFVQAVEREIRDYWLAAGRARFLEAIERGRSTGSTAHIVRTLESHGLPREFFYLALQESDLNPDAVGPSTRFGRAKGMWQFIPVTAARYGLDPGPNPNAPRPDARDTRLDPRRATDAAARYLRDIYTELAQASGLLVMAAYNWGEHRVNPRLQELEAPDEVFKATFADVEQSPEARNYWRFLEQHADRMPEETKDYVIKIFAAAVLGSNPEVFGLPIRDPLVEFSEGVTAGR